MGGANNVLSPLTSRPSMRTARTLRDATLYLCVSGDSTSPSIVLADHEAPLLTANPDVLTTKPFAVAHLCALHGISRGGRVDPRAIFAGAVPQRFEKQDRHADEGVLAHDDVQQVRFRNGSRHQVDLR